MESGSWNRRVGRPATLIWFVIMTAYHVVTGMNLVPASQMTNFTLSYIMVQLVLGFVLIGEDLDERMEQHLPNLLDNDTVAQAIGPYADILLLIDKTPWLSPSEILLVVRVIIGILLVSLGIAVWYLWLEIDKKRKERQ